MNDLISRQAAIDAIDAVMPVDPNKSEYASGIACGAALAMTYVKQLQSADRPQGKWIYGEHNVAMCDGYRCNRCDFFVPWDYEHKFIDFINDYHYCPSCGARMKGADRKTEPQPEREGE